MRDQEIRPNGPVVLREQEATETSDPSPPGNGRVKRAAAGHRVRIGDVNHLSELGEKIFLDRYALKDMEKASLDVGDIVVVCTDSETGQREIGTVSRVDDGDVSVSLSDGEVVSRSREHVDLPVEVHPDQLQARVARGIAEAEDESERAEWEERFRWLLESWKFVPGGRILTAAGTDQDLTYYNCYVVPSPHDSRDGIIRTLSQMTEIMSRGGGVGINLSTLRPRYAYVKGVNGRSSGSVSWGSLYSFVTGLIEQGGSRRGALMLILNVWHPDVAEFISAKREMGRMTNANISVGVTDDFMSAVDDDAEWPLVFPDTSHAAYESEWDGDLNAWRKKGYPVVEHKRIRARELWNTIIESAWESAEPGLWFVERANKQSNSHYYAPLVCTNPCGEQPLPGWAVCNLGAINLSRFNKGSHVDWEGLRRTVRYAVRFLDNVIDATPYFFDENEDQQLQERRIGLGTMGLAELMIRCGVRYGSPEGNAFIDRLFEFITTTAYLASADYAAEKGAFPRFEAEPYLESGFMRSMPQEVRSAVATKGIRNVTLITQAPTGTTGTMVGTSTGIEPFYSWSYYRQSRLGLHEEKVGVVEEWRTRHPDEELPEHFVTAMALLPEEHIGVQAAIQRWVDSSISKTCNVPNDYTVEQTRDLYEYMYHMGCKGGTVYRDGSRDEQVLRTQDDEAESDGARSGASVNGKQANVQPRPRRMDGTTHKVTTPLGKAYVTVNRTQDDDPFEVFVNLGKAGSDLSADAEAIGRLISLIQRLPSPLSPEQRLQNVAEELEGIGGSRTVGFGAEQVRSLPDGISQALRQELSQEPTDEAAANQPGLFPGADLCPSCGYASFVRIEGCRKCFSCGFSEC